MLLIVFCSACASAGGSTSAPRNPAFDKYPAGVNGHTTLVYYDIEGRTIDELRREMRKKGPDIDGTTFIGEARSPMRWQWRVDAVTNTQCAIRDVTVSIAEQITLPRWNPPPDADSAAVSEWKRFINALEIHEAGHKDISAKAGREIVRQVRSLTESCFLINTKANDIAREIVEKTRNEQVLYDATTRHGITQGTTFGSRPRN